MRFWYKNSKLFILIIVLCNLLLFIYFYRSLANCGKNSTSFQSTKHPKNNDVKFVRNRQIIHVQNQLQTTVVDSKKIQFTTTRFPLLQTTTFLSSYSDSSPVENRKNSDQIKYENFIKEQEKGRIKANEEARDVFDLFYSYTPQISCSTKV